MSADNAGLVEAVIAAAIADNQVIEQRHVEEVGRVDERIVNRASSWLGVGSPLGWLCTTSSAVVPGVRHAGTKTSGSETGVV